MTMNFFDDRTLEKLVEPLNPAFVSSRKQAGTTLSYIEGHHAIREMNRIFGYDGWSRRTVECKIEHTHTYKDKYDNDKLEACASAIVEVQVGPIVRMGVGFGNGIVKADGMHKDAFEQGEKFYT